MTKLPRNYHVALCLVDAGVPDEGIARALGVEPEAVRPMLAIAAAKLSALLDEHARSQECRQNR